MRPRPGITTPHRLEPTGAHRHRGIPRRGPLGCGACSDARACGTLSESVIGRAQALTLALGRCPPKPHEPVAKFGYNGLGEASISASVTCSAPRNRQVRLNNLQLSLSSRICNPAAMRAPFRSLGYLPPFPKSRHGRASSWHQMTILSVADQLCCRNQ